MALFLLSMFMKMRNGKIVGEKRRFKNKYYRTRGVCCDSLGRVTSSNETEFIPIDPVYLYEEEHK